jgi:hypothetical protein
LLVSAREAGLQRVYTVLTRDLSLVQREEIDSLLVAASPDAESTARSRLEQFKAVARKESPESLLALLDQLSDVRSLGLTAWPALTDIHPATRRLLADWAYRYSIWNLRRFSAAKREAIVICFLQLNKGEASHDLSRFLSFGKEGAMRGREFGDQLHTFSCLSILHNAVVAWNTIQVGKIVSQLRGEGQQIEDETLSHVTPLLRKHINPFGRYYFDLNRIQQDPARERDNP